MSGRGEKYGSAVSELFESGRDTAYQNGLLRLRIRVPKTTAFTPCTWESESGANEAVDER